MRRLFLFLSFIVLIYFTYGFYYATYSIEIYKNESAPRSHPFYHDYNGVSHVVTSFSKGSLTPPKILLEAARADINFLFFTDLNLTDRPYNIQGYHGNVFTFSTQKLSYLDSHILIYTSNSDFYFDSMSAANAQLHQHFSEPPGEEKKFLAVLAHPLKKNHGWTGEYPPGIDGIEVINMRHLWQETWFHNRERFVWSIFTYPFNPQISLLRLISVPHRELELWDFLNKDHRVLGFLGNETTAKIFNVLGLNFTFPSYEKSFKFGSNHILLESELTGYVESDRKKIFTGLKKGHFYFSFDSLGSPIGFAAYIVSEGQRYLMGSEIALKPGMDLVIDLPKGINVPSIVEVIKDGSLFFKSNQSQITLPIKESGNYRIIVKLKPLLPLPDREVWFGWIYTNPFFIKKT